jgi:bifunctional UDP-N-acetylglucosamine pyrophosphorylase/glucosamine-1-phosphate N-acetyltransferase
MKLFPIILAAGKGTRMNSSLPKVLHPVGGKSMLQHVIDSCRTLDADRITIVYGHGADLVKAAIGSAEDLRWAIQKEQLGTGHAVLQAKEFIDEDAIIIIAYGDVPLVKADTLRLLENDIKSGSDLSILTTKLKNPTGYGRIVRDDVTDKMTSIVEEKDATDDQRKIDEGNTGFLAAKGKDLLRWLSQIKSDNAQGEYYLTDCIALAVKEGANVTTVLCKRELEVLGVNDRMQQSTLEREYQRIQAKNLMKAGVTLIDPARCDIRGQVTAGKDVSIDVNNIFIGDVSLGNNVVIESGCVIKDCQIADNVNIKANSVLDSAIIGNNCDVGPFARVRPDTVIKDSAKIGNFVEIKKTTVGEGSKVSHLSYIGDTTMGEGVNIGAGTITCNYDGVNKHQTIIGNNVFVGSDTQLVAPVTLGDGANIGAGSTITRDAPNDTLTLSRSKQLNIKGWKRPIKKQK